MSKTARRETLAAKLARSTKTELIHQAASVGISVPRTILKADLISRLVDHYRARHQVNHDRLEEKAEFQRREIAQEKAAYEGKMARDEMLQARTEARKVKRKAKVEDSTVQKLREEFRKLMRNALHCASKDEWMAAVRKLAGDNPTPEQWVEAARKATTKCDRCTGSGQYQWGACVNGKMTHSAQCYRCQGKGHFNQEDYRRNWGYDQHIKVL